MKKAYIRILKIMRNVALVMIAVILIFLLVRFIGKAINNKTPEGGINESMYVEEAFSEILHEIANEQD